MLVVGGGPVGIVKSWRTVAILFVVVLAGLWLLSTSGLVVSDEARDLRGTFGL